MKSVYVVESLRTPIGKYAGSLSSLRPDDLAAIAIKAVLSKLPNLPLEQIEDVIWGAANQAGEDNRNIARMAGLMAGLPTSVAGITVNRLCASGLQAIMDGARQIACGDAEIVIAGGSESMSRAPFVMAKSDAAFGRAPEIFDTTLGWRFVNSKLSALYHPYSMGETAENVAEQYHISREMQDQFAHQSQLKYHNAHINGKFKDEIIPIELVTKKHTFIFDTDEHPRLSDTATLAKLKPAFRANGTVTAGNSSGINDGAAALILVSEAVLKAYNLIPKARVVSMAVAGVDPSIMGIGPVPASQKAMQRAGISGSDLGLVELNEAFASQSLASIQELGLNPDIVNINGGSIALGHPLGCSGARISTTLIHEFAKRKNAKFGLATMCIGVGQGAAIVYENLS